MPPSQAVHEAWTNWLSTFHWDHFATLTFAQPRTEARARRAFAAFVRTVRLQTFGGSVGYFCGYECGTFGRLHLHALMRTNVPQTELAINANSHPSKAVPNKVLWACWFERFGRAKVETYDPKRGAAGYVSKYVTKRLSFYDLDNMVPLARSLPRGAE